MKHALVLVIWSFRFEEAVASIFVSELRAAGIPVRLVGLAPPGARGAHGLGITPDLSLATALPLVRRVTALIFPCASDSAGRLFDDPRLGTLFRRVRGSTPEIITGPLNAHQQIALRRIGAPVGRMTTYPAHENLVPFVRELAARLILLSDGPVHSS